MLLYDFIHYSEVIDNCSFTCMNHKHHISEQRNHVFLTHYEKRTRYNFDFVKCKIGCFFVFNVTNKYGN